MRRVGVVGLGLIGSVIARRLLAAGFAVEGIDLEAGKRAALEQAGGRVVTSIRALVGADAIVLAVFDTAQVEEAVAALMPAEQQVVVSVSTCEPGRMATLAERAAESGVILLEMPISGSSAQLEAGEAVGLVAGDPARIDGITDILQTICPRRFTLPAMGDGARAKLAINLILGLNRAALAEGLVFAERLGLDLRAFLPVARESAAYSQIMDVKGARMIEGDFTPQGRIVQSAKDFALILAEARHLPLASVYADLMAGCIAAGQGDRDNAAVIDEVRRRIGAGGLRGGA